VFLNRERRFESCRGRKLAGQSAARVTRDARKHRFGKPMRDLTEHHADRSSRDSSSVESLSQAASTLSSAWAIFDVPGIGTISGDRASNHAVATWDVETPCAAESSPTTASAMVPESMFGE